MTAYIETRAFPDDLSTRIGDLIPSWCRSVVILHHDNGAATARAHKSEIGRVRTAINQARAEARLAAMARR
jgi:hypothetical protein